jgi:hypothetical protein
MRDGRCFGRAPDPHHPPEMPPRNVNFHRPRFDADHRRAVLCEGLQRQAAVNEHRPVVAAEITSASTDFGPLGPMVTAPLREPLAFEGLAAFMVEATFLGLWISAGTTCPPGSIWRRFGSRR